MSSILTLGPLEPPSKRAEEPHKLLRRTTPNVITPVRGSMLWAELLRETSGGDIALIDNQPVKILEEASGPVPAKVSDVTPMSIPPSQRSTPTTTPPPPSHHQSNDQMNELILNIDTAAGDPPAVDPPAVDPPITLADFLRIRKVIATVLSELTGQFVELPVPEEIDLLLPGTSGAVKNLQQLLRYTQTGSKRNGSGDLKNSFKAAYKQLGSSPAAPPRRTTRQANFFSSSSYHKDS